MNNYQYHHILKYGQTRVNMVGMGISVYNTMTLSIVIGMSSDEE